MEEKLRYLSSYDPLTGLYNRTYFEQQIQSLQQRGAFPVAIVSADLDALKLINDTMGHAAGDEILRRFANILHLAFPEPAVAARIGGDEFAVIIAGASEPAVEEMVASADRLLSDHNAAKPEIPISASFGFAVAQSRETLEEVVRRSDRNMYREKLRRSSTAVGTAVHTLVAALAAKDHVAEGHTERVRDLACRIGTAMRLSRHEIAELALLAEVHDLGKVGIPDSVLFKKSRLSEDERLTMMDHPLIGYRIACSSGELTLIAELILHHHERWDGTGYPSGLKGDDIPMACRILAVADAFDAMTSGRPYQEAISVTEAIKEIVSGSGSQFDPKVVRAFLNVTGGGGQTCTTTFSAKGG